MSKRKEMTVGELWVDVPVNAFGVQNAMVKCVLVGGYDDWIAY
jgi:hypothetical protein